VEIELAASAHILYWVGVYERNGRAQLEIINALRGRFEGAKLRELVAEWFQPRQEGGAVSEDLMENRSWKRSAD